MRRSLAAAVPYFAAVFAAGFALGTIRVLALEPAVGPVLAVLAELPVMLAVVFAAARWAVGRYEVPIGAAPRLTMGLTAFALLMAAELALGLWGFGRGLAQIGADFTTLPGALGLAGQSTLALMPLVVGRRA